MGDTDHLLHSLARMARFERVLRLIPFAAPAAGAEVVLTVPGGSVWRPLSLFVSLTTSAAVANRLPSLVVDDTTNTVLRIPQAAVIAAGATVALTWAEDGTPNAGSAASGVLATSMPEMALPAGYRLRTITSAIDVADQYTAGALWVEEVLAQPQGVHELRDLGVEAQLITSSLAAEGAA